MYNHTVTIRCPAALVDMGNHLVNCFESCYPGAPVLQLEPEATHAEIRVACREEFIQAITAIVGMGTLPASDDPLAAAVKAYEWNIQGEEGWLVDMGQANEALALVDLNPEVVNEDRIIVVLA
jgi:hypothetical protein